MSSQMDIGIEKISSCNRCELVGAEDVSFLEGRVKTFIESLGLSDKQEKASKDIARDVLWDWFNFITDHNLDYLIDKKEWYQENRSLTKR
jgi:hypothetical protein